MTAIILPFPKRACARGVLTPGERAELRQIGVDLAPLGLDVSPPVALDDEYEYFSVRGPGGRAIYAWREGTSEEFTVAEVDDAEDILVPLASVVEIRDAVALIVRHLAPQAA